MIGCRIGRRAKARFRRSTYFNKVAISWRSSSYRGSTRTAFKYRPKKNTIRIAGKKTVSYPEGVSVHRRERIFGEFDRTLSLPVQLDPDGIKAEYRDGILALFLPRSERDKPRTIKIS